MTAETVPTPPTREPMTHVETLRACGYDPIVRWVCGVVRSGFNNGAGCTSADPHGGDWGCCYRVELSIALASEADVHREASV